MSMNQETLEFLTMLGPWAIFGLLVVYGVAKILYTIARKAMS